MNLNLPPMKPATREKVRAEMTKAVTEMFPKAAPDKSGQLIQAATAISTGNPAMMAEDAKLFHNLTKELADQEASGDAAVAEKLSGDFKHRAKVIAATEILHEDWPAGVPRKPIPAHLIPR